MPRAGPRIPWLCSLPHDVAAGDANGEFVGHAGVTIRKHCKRQHAVQHRPIGKAGGCGVDIQAVAVRAVRQPHTCLPDLRLSFAEAVERGVDHRRGRAVLLAGKATTRSRKPLLIDDDMRVIALACFVGIAGAKGALMIAHAAVEQSVVADRHDSAEEKMPARGFERSAVRITLYAFLVHKDG